MKKIFNLKLVTVALIAANIASISAFAQTEVKEAVTPTEKKEEKIQVSKATNDNPLGLPDTVAKVGDIIISKTEYDILVKMLQKRGIKGPETKEQAKSLVQNYANKLLLSQQAKELGLTENSEFKIEKEIMSNDFISNALVEHLAKEISISDDDVKLAYDNEAKRLKEIPLNDKKEFLASQILVKDRKTADKIIKDLLNKKISFDQAAKRYSIDESGKTGGNIGWFNSSMIIPELMVEIKKMKTGLLRKPIETEFGFHIINLRDIRVPEMLPFDKVKDSIKQRLEILKLQEKIKQESDKSPLKIQNFIE